MKNERPIPASQLKPLDYGQRIRVRYPHFYVEGCVANFDQRGNVTLILYKYADSYIPIQQGTPAIQINVFKNCIVAQSEGWMNLSRTPLPSFTPEDAAAVDNPPEAAVRGGFTGNFGLLF